MNEYAINSRTYQVPSNWNELNGKQLRRIVQIHLSRLHPIKAKVLFLKILLWKNNWWFKRLPDAAIYDMLLLTDWLFDKDGHYQKPNLVKQILPSFRLFFTRYYGPGDALGNISMAEWARSEKHFIDFRTSNKIEDLDKLIAVLYRKRDKKKKLGSVNYKGDIREDFNDYNYLHRALRLRHTRTFTKFAILYYYEGCRNYIINNPDYREIFHNKEVNSAKVDNKKGWIDFIINLAGKSFGNKAVDEISGSNMHTVLYQLNLILKQQNQK